VADSVILNIKSWRSSEDTGRKHLVDISPQFTSESSYTFEEKIVDAEGTLSVTCGKYFTYIWSDKVIDYSIDSGVTMHGQLIMLTNNVIEDTASVIAITGTIDTTKVSVILVD
jgi:hypothetical protein